MKLHVHHHTMDLYTQYKFHEIPSIAHLVMAEDRKIHLNLGNRRAIIPTKLVTS